MRSSIFEMDPSALRLEIATQMEKADPALLLQRVGEIEKNYGALTAKSLALVQDFCKTAPLPQGVFVGEQDRLQMYRAFCGLLSRLEAVSAELGSLLFALSSAEASILSLYEADAWAEAALFLLSQKQEARQECEESLAKLLQDREKRNACTETVSVLHRQISSGLERPLRDLLCEGGKLSDGEHEGKACDPRGLLRLCQGFCLSVEQGRLQNTH